MLLLKMTQIKKSFGDRKLFSFSDFSVGNKDRVGLIGLNGCGKTTLLEMIAGNMQPDCGTIQRFGEISYVSALAETDNRATAQALKEWQVAGCGQGAAASGGEKMKLCLAGAFGRQSHLLLLDEPTSNLDLEGIALLRKKLHKHSSFVLVSHDIALLDEVCNRIVELREHALFFYPGNYAAYRQQREISLRAQQRAYETYQVERDRLQATYAQKKAQAQRMCKKPHAVSSSEFKTRNLVAASRSNDGRQKRMERQAKSVQSRLARLEVKERPRKAPRIKLQFDLTRRLGNRVVVCAERFAFAYETRSVFADASFFVYNRQRVGLVGPNGAGKTTLLRCMERQAPGIKLAPQARLGFLHQAFDTLSSEKSVLGSVMESSVRDETIARLVLARLLFAANDMDKLVSVLSGGERIKLSLAKLFVSDANVIAMDEPTNYLDAPSVEALIALLRGYEGTLLFASHDRTFMDEVATDLLVIHGGQIEMAQGNLSTYEARQQQRRDSATVQRNLLEMRLVQLSALLARAAPDCKEDLERDYRSAVAQLKAWENCDAERTIH